ncbi:hypothetical protein DFH27DRAFT_536285 [Peziza echinospora]|nr:hypothetical protein DFH27DRAFT_536285 [Peziza echinospora]
MASRQDAFVRYRMLQAKGKRGSHRSRGWNRRTNCKFGFVGAVAFIGVFSVLSFGNDWSPDNGQYVDFSDTYQTANPEHIHDGHLESALLKSSEVFSTTNSYSTLTDSNKNWHSSTLTPNLFAFSQHGQPTTTQAAFSNIEPSTLASTLFTPSLSGQVATQLAFLNTEETETKTEPVQSTPIESVSVDSVDSFEKTNLYNTSIPSSIHAYIYSQLSPSSASGPSPDAVTTNSVFKPDKTQASVGPSTTDTYATQDLQLDGGMEVDKHAMSHTLVAINDHTTISLENIERENEFVDVDSGRIIFFGRWIRSEHSKAMVPTFSVSYAEIYHNSSGISIALSLEPGAKSTTILYTYSAGNETPVYHPMVDVGPGILYLPPDESLPPNQLKRSRIIFPLGDDDENRPALGLHGAYLEKHPPTSATGPPHNKFPKEAKQDSLHGGYAQLNRSRPLIEVITDSLWGEFGMGPMVGAAGRELGNFHSSARFVLHWGWLLSAKYGADMRLIGVDGICVTSPCPGMAYPDVGLGSVFFRAGPPKSRYFRQKWNFDGQRRPDVIVINVGQTDSLALLYLQAATNKNSTTSLAMKNQFENALVDFIRSIRQRAYPMYFDPRSGLENDGHGVMPEIAARDHSSVIPIYILPPFHNTDMMTAIKSAIRRVILSQDMGYRGTSECCIYEVDVSAWMSTVDGSGNGAHEGSCIPRVTAMPISSTGTKAELFKSRRRRSRRYHGIWAVASESRRRSN